MHSAKFFLLASINYTIIEISFIDLFPSMKTWDHQEYKKKNYFKSNYFHDHAWMHQK